MIVIWFDLKKKLNGRKIQSNNVIITFICFAWKLHGKEDDNFLRYLQEIFRTFKIYFKCNTF